MALSTSRVWGWMPMPMSRVWLVERPLLAGDAELAPQASSSPPAANTAVPTPARCRKERLVKADPDHCGRPMSPMSALPSFRRTRANGPDGTEGVKHRLVEVPLRVPYRLPDCRREPPRRAPTAPRNGG